MARPRNSCIGAAERHEPQPRPARTLRRGLRYNMERLRMQFGGLVSSSNMIEADEVHVETDADLVWTTRLLGGDP